MKPGVGLKRPGMAQVVLSTNPDRPLLEIGAHQIDQIFAQLWC
jgi:hypothetical protein